MYTRWKFYLLHFDISKRERYRLKTKASSSSFTGCGPRGSLPDQSIGNTFPTLFSLHQEKLESTVDCHLNCSRFLSLFLVTLSKEGTSVFKWLRVQLMYFLQRHITSNRFKSWKKCSHFQINYGYCLVVVCDAQISTRASGMIKEKNVWGEFKSNAISHHTNREKCF